jgi:hypothetical protein
MAGKIRGNIFFIAAGIIVQTFKIKNLPGKGGEETREANCNTVDVRPDADQNSAVIINNDVRRF